MNSQQARIITLTSISHFINDGQSAVFPLMIPLLGFFVTSNLLQAILASAFYAFSSFASPFAVSWVERGGNMGRGMGVGLFILALGTMGLGLSVLPSGELPSLSYVLVLFFAALSGFGSSFFHPIGASLIQSSFDEDVQGTALGINGTAGSSGRAIFLPVTAIVFSYFLLPQTGYYSLLYGLTIIGSVGLVVSLFVISYFSRNQVRVKRTKKADGDRRIPIGPVIRKTWLLLLITIVRNLLGTGVYIYLPNFLIHEHLSTYSIGLGFIMGVLTVGGIGGQPLFGRMSDFLGRRISLFLTTIGSGVSMLLFLATTSLYPYSLVFLALFGTFAFSGFGVLLPIAYMQVPKENRVVGNAVIWAAIGSGSAAGPLIAQLLAENWATGSLFYSFAVLSAATVAVAFLSLGLKINRNESGGAPAPAS